MPTHYFYVDDDPDELVRPAVDALIERGDQLDIQLRKPEEFSEQLRAIDASGVDGVILDLRLDLSPNDEGRHAQYRASAIAQEMRTRASEGEMADIPIVLWSTRTKLDGSFDRDTTGHDLFDRLYTKDTVAADPERVARELVSLVEGYRTISESRGKHHDGPEVMKQLLGVPQTMPLDERIGYNFFETHPGKTPVHEYTRFILGELLDAPGPLIEVTRLAALLGVDSETSTDWSRLLREHLQPAAYVGVFSDAWPRWWRGEVDHWWAQNSSATPPLRLLTAKERVSILLARTGLEGLHDAKPIKPEYSTRYTTICEGTRRPLDPIDGVMIRSMDVHPWQETRYISAYAALERIGYERGIRVHPSERGRLSDLAQ